MDADECVHYYYDSGYCCSILKENTGKSNVDSDDVKKYCWGYHYEDCPVYKKYHSSSGTVCFLTSACVEARGLPDNCDELQTLRLFRDTYLKSLMNGPMEINEYYKIAPAIVTKIKQCTNATELFDDIYTSLVLTCVELIKAGKNEEAHQLYRGYVKQLGAKYLA